MPRTSRAPVLSEPRYDTTHGHGNGGDESAPWTPGLDHWLEVEHPGPLEPEGSRLPLMAPEEAHAIAADFEQRRRVLAAAARRTVASEDGDAIHDLRVASRRLLGVLRLWRGAFRADARRPLRRALRRLRRGLGRARELEVHVALLRRFASEPADAALAVCERLEVRLERARQRAVLRTTPLRLRALEEDLAGAASELEERLRERPGLEERALARTVALERRARVALRAALAGGDDDALHSARIAIKKLRYAAEAMGAAAPVSVDLGRLRELQERLGTFWDLATVLERLRRRRRGCEDGVALDALMVRVVSEKRAAARRFKQLARPGL